MSTDPDDTEGWVLVPREATKEMIEAARDGSIYIPELWRNMLSAVPHHPGKMEGDNGD